MKFTAVFLLALVAAVLAGPVQISDNNVGDIVTVGVNANANLSSEVNVNIISVILALLNQQALIVAGQDGEASPTPAQPRFQITPEMIEKVKSLLSKQ
jgi:hypothetical protein